MKAIGESLVNQSPFAIPPPQDSNGLSDPYVTIAVGAEVAPEDRQTLAQKKTLNPTWDEQFVQGPQGGVGNAWDSGRCVDCKKNQASSTTAISISRMLHFKGMKTFQNEIFLYIS